MSDTPSVAHDSDPGIQAALGIALFAAADLIPVSRFLKPRALPCRMI